jgi:hypothetical protein
MSSLAVACATPYQKAGFSGGYKEARLEPNVYLVSFKGSPFTHKSRVRDFALLRCAELTLENGYRFFAIAPGPLPPRAKEVSGQQGIFSVHRPEASHTIICFSEKPADFFLWYEARYLARSIRQKYRLANGKEPTK